MAELGMEFDTGTVEPAAPREFTAIPTGPQMVWIVNSDKRAIKPKPGQDPNGDYGSFIALEIEVIQGEYERRKLFENLVLEHSNPTTVEIARQTLSEICKACKKLKIRNTEELHSIPFIVDLVVEPDRRNRNLAPGQTPYPLTNRIKAYRALEDGAPAPTMQPRQAAAAPAQPAASGWGAPAGQQQPSGAAPAAKPPSGALPWGE